MVCQKQSNKSTSGEDGSKPEGNINPYYAGRKNLSLTVLLVVNKSNWYAKRFLESLADTSFVIGVIADRADFSINRGRVLGFALVADIRNFDADNRIFCDET
jgi:hypothetical protein